VTLNQKIGGAGNSQHCLGQASDITVPGMPVDALFKFIINQTKLPFDQIIQEFGQWVWLRYPCGAIPGMNQSRFRLHKTCPTV
jgi:hypothetical protein